MHDIDRMRVAIVHDWLVTRGGAERVLEQMFEIWPDADLFAVLDCYGEADRKFLGGRHAKTTFIQKLPNARRLYRTYLPLMPLAIEQLDLSAYDVVISSSHAVAKGVITGPDQFHMCYIHSPIRYAWDLQHQYLKESNLEGGVSGWAARVVLHRIRQWDARSSTGVDAFVANSHYIARRVQKVYRRESTVIYPPVQTSGFKFCASKDPFYLTASRMVPYKKIPEIVEAFRSMPSKRLIVIGDGPEFNKAKARAASNVTMLGYQPFEVLHDYMRRAKAFIFNAEEDFGIVTVEAQACGTPVIAFGSGGARETVVGADARNATGIFYGEQSADAIVSAVLDFERRAQDLQATDCRNNAERFSEEKFRSSLRDFFWERYLEFRDERIAVLNV
jgi:glycosyltransferase involved in cell wall biosynthesis